MSRIFFLFLQKNHRSLVQTRLQVTHVETVGIMKQTYEVFKHDGQEVMLLTCRLPFLPDGTA